MSNMVRGQNFPLQDCFNKRIIVWNEFNFMGSAEDTVKMLTEGTPFSHACKYKQNATLYRTPMIMTSNNTTLENNIYFKPRCYFEDWSSCPKLKNYNAYPNPLTLILLFELHVLSNEKDFFKNFNIFI